MTLILPHICLFLKHTKCPQGGGTGKSQDQSSRGSGSCALCKVCMAYVQMVTLAPLKIMFTTSMSGRPKEPIVGVRSIHHNPEDRLWLTEF